MVKLKITFWPFLTEKNGLLAASGSPDSGEAVLGCRTQSNKKPLNKVTMYI